MGLYSWQRKCLREWEKNQYRGIVNAVTGSGKTTLALACIRMLQDRNPDLRVRIVVPTIALANQWRQAILRDKVSKGQLPGFYGNGIQDDSDRAVMIYVVNSARDSLADHVRKDFALNHHVLLICDECHRYLSRENYKIFSFLSDSIPETGIHVDSVPNADTCINTAVPEAGTRMNSAVPEAGTRMNTAVPEAGTRINTAVPEAGTRMNSAVPEMSIHVDSDPEAGIHNENDPHCPGRQSDFLSLFPCYHCLGLSATPFDGVRDADLKRVLGDEIFRYDFSDASDDGIIAPYTICQVSVDFLPKERDAYTEICDRISKATAILYKTYPWLKELPQSKFYKELRALAASADMDPSEPAATLTMLLYQRKALVVNSKARIFCCMDLLKRLNGSKKILIFCERIEQAETLQRQIIREYGSICGIYHSKLSKEAKRRNLDAFRNNHIRILVSCRALDEGLDVPDADVGIVLSSSAVTRQRIQRLGRIIRTNPQKDQACLYYLYIRESSEDAAYLKATESASVFDLRYYTAERDFSNDLYLYSALQLYESVSQPRSADLPGVQNAVKTGLMIDHERSDTNNALSELRKCILEGMVRSDYLLSDKIKERRLSSAGSVHERNYWRVMRWIGRYFQ